LEEFLNPKATTEDEDEDNGDTQPSTILENAFLQRLISLMEKKRK
jgi:hypothetical protein